MTSQALLVIQQRDFTPDDLRRIGSSVYWRFKLNAMIVRERLPGDGWAVLCRGDEERMRTAAEVLEQESVTSRVLTLPIPAFLPRRVRDLSAFKDHVMFRLGEGDFRLNRGDPVLAILSGGGVDSAGGHGEDRLARLGSLYRKRIFAGLRLTLFFQPPEEKTPMGLFMGPPPAVLSGTDQDRKRYGDSIHSLIGHISRLGDPFTLIPTGDLPGMEMVAGSGGEAGEESPAPVDNAVTSECLLAILHFQEPLSGLNPENAPWLQSPLSEPALKVEHEPPLPGLTAAAILAGTALAGRRASAAEPDGEAILSPAPPGDVLPPPPPVTTARFGLMASKKRMLASAGFIAFFFVLANVLPPKALHSLARFAEYYGYEKGILFFAVAAVLFVMSFRHLKYKRIMENTPTSKTRSVAMGIAEIKGNAIRCFNLLSPITLTPCVYYRVRKYRRNNKDQWNQYAYLESSGVEFDLEDETGRIAVDPTGATFVGMQVDTYTGGVMMGAKGRFLPIPPNEKWTEELIFEKAPMYVLGYVRPMERYRETLGEKLRERLKRLKSDPKALMVFDENGDGRIDQYEWEKVREAAEQDIIRESLHGRNQGDEGGGGQAVIGKPAQWGSPFIIAATRIEEKLTRRYGMLAVACFAGALIGAGWGVLRVLS